MSSLDSVSICCVSTTANYNPQVVFLVEWCEPQRALFPWQTSLVKSRPTAMMHSLQHRLKKVIHFCMFAIEKVNWPSFIPTPDPKHLILISVTWSDQAGNLSDKLIITCAFRALEHKIKCDSPLLCIPTHLSLSLSLCVQAESCWSTEKSCIAVPSTPLKTLAMSTPSTSWNPRTAAGALITGERGMLEWRLFNFWSRPGDL